MNHNPLAIDVTDLSKSFAGKEAVSKINLQVNRGEIFGFLGPNGSGKTTTIRMLCGLLTPDSGRGTCLGYDIFTQAEEIKKHVGYMTQSFSLYVDLTVYENLNFIAQAYNIKNRKEHLKRTFEWSGFSKARQKQLAGELSGGWKQRLALAAAMLHDPQLLLLDEPTAGVDPKARRDFWDQIHELSGQGVTTLVSTHYMDEAERCHELAYIIRGHLLTRGTIEDVIQHAALHTWTVRGENLTKLSAALRNIPAILQVAPFGRELHVTGKDPDALKDVIKPYQTADYVWTPTTPSLEDVFIALVGTDKENTRVEN